jgi:hypothetical protein
MVSRPAVFHFCSVRVPVSVDPDELDASFRQIWEGEMSDLVLLLHVVFGVLTALGGLVVLMEALLLPASSRRLLWSAAVVAGCCWVAFVAGGAWYLTGYGVGKTYILNGPRPWAHEIVMEVKEHVFLLLLLVATMLPMLVAEYRRRDERGMRVVVGTAAGLVTLLALLMEGFGGIINSGVRAGIFG